MKYSRFEDLPVWQAAIDFALKVFEFTNKAEFRGLGDTKGQLERAALSISNNIAEGFERGATTELIYFLYIAKGSSGETRSILRLCERLRHFDNFKFEISDLTGRAVNISKQLNGWLESLKNSDIKGARYLTQRERAKRQQDQEFAEFDQEMARYRQELLEKLQSREKPALQSEGDGNIREL